MPRRPARLSNCYLPLPLRIDTCNSESINDTCKSKTKRHDGRSDEHELRQLCLETSVISRALGSSLVELGHSKILAEVHIAAAMTNSSTKFSSNFYGNNEATNDIGCLKFHVKYAPFIGIDQVSQRTRSVSTLDSNYGNSNGNGNGNGNSSSKTNITTISQSMGKLNQELIQRESDLSRQLTAALLPVIILERYPKCAVVVCVTVLQDDGCCLSAAITAASMALIDARVELRDVVTSCTVAVVDNNDDVQNKSDKIIEENENEEDQWTYLADPTEQEITNTNSVAIICLAMTPNYKEVTLWTQSGRLSSDMASQAMELCRDGCRTMHKFMRESWI